VSDAEELQGVQRRRSSLYHATLGLEAALSSPTGNLARWQDRALAASLALHDAIVAHVADSERPGEFLDSITTRAPHLIAAAKRLIDEHEVLVSSADELVRQVKSIDTTADASIADNIRDHALELMGRLVRHRQRGTDLVYAAYGEDLGSSG